MKRHGLWRSYGDMKRQIVGVFNNIENAFVKTRLGQKILHDLSQKTQNYFSFLKFKKCQKYHILGMTNKFWIY